MRLIYYVYGETLSFKLNKIKRWTEIVSSRLRLRCLDLRH